MLNNSVEQILINELMGAIVDVNNRLERLGWDASGQLPHTVEGLAEVVKDANCLLRSLGEPSRALSIVALGHVALEHQEAA